jgi:hypothetical protein
MGEPVPMHFCLNDTSTQEDGSLIQGGQLDRYLRPIWRELDASGAGYTAHRQPKPGVVNIYPNHRHIYDRQQMRGERTSVLISHGIASKTYRSGTKAGSFRHIVVPGPALAEEVIASGVPRNKVRQLGYPKLDPVHNGEVASPWPERDGRVRVLWAPTHGGGSERWPLGRRTAPGAGATTWWHRDELLGLLDPDRCLIMEAPHPRHHPQRQATLAQYVGADVVIADGGSTIYESWACGLPVVMPDWICAGRNLTRAGGATLEARVYRERVGWHVDDPAGFPAAVAEAAACGISAAEVAFAEQVLPASLRGHGGKLHAEFLLSLDGKVSR